MKDRGRDNVELADKVRLGATVNGHSALVNEKNTRPSDKQYISSLAV